MNDKYVWYASYGSNLDIDRFYLYIKGGPLPGKKRIYPGCKNKTLPKKSLNIKEQYQLYFAKEANKTWNGRGVGFITHDKKPDTITYMKMYLITDDQFRDVVQQESDTDDLIVIDFDKAIKDGAYTFREGGWYGHLIYLGDWEGYPAFTFTNEASMQVLNYPDGEYLKTICKGLVKNFDLSVANVIDYLLACPGVNGEITKEDLSKLFANI